MSGLQVSACSDATEHDVCRAPRGARLTWQVCGDGCGVHAASRATHAWRALVALVLRVYANLRLEASSLVPVCKHVKVQCCCKGTDC